ncbi:MAG: hypothetical protein JWO49_725 [Arthrobacter sp.]|nr:hypothetical protein [Arthrobacter sp.]MCU1547664.1 hypothetical protein [Arthrobacter sp.]
MAGNRSTLRTDLDYLSRRTKPAQRPESTPPAGAVRAPNLPTPDHATPGSGGLTLHPASSRPDPVPQGSTTRSPTVFAPSSRSAPASARTAAVPERVFPAPGFGSVRQLDEANPVVRLNARQSAIGSLLVAGARSVTWEDRHFTTGARHAEGHVAGTPVNTPGNRPLADMQDSSGVVSLRHVRLLRRALFIAGEAPLTIGVFDGAAAVVAPRNDAGSRAVLYVSRIGAVLELRAEFVPAAADDPAVWALFGFTMTIPLDQRVLLR